MCVVPYISISANNMQNFPTTARSWGGWKKKQSLLKQSISPLERAASRLWEEELFHMWAESL
jgi:hypothetical protein